MSIQMQLCKNANICSNFASIFCRELSNDNFHASLHDSTIPPQSMTLSRTLTPTPLRNAGRPRAPHRPRSHPHQHAHKPPQPMTLSRISTPMTVFLKVRVPQTALNLSSILIKCAFTFCIFLSATGSIICDASNAKIYSCSRTESTRLAFIPCFAQ